MAEVKAPTVPKAAPIGAKEKKAARAEFTAIKGPLNMITSWELGDVILDPLFTYTATTEQANNLANILNKIR
ncbi:hypothetical protein J7J90_00935 [Candidatus Micrarchaeota archaeon]|nr:hypothetical protein [Candidatus Micrarchaeota archaeon]